MRHRRCAENFSQSPVSFLNQDLKKNWVFTLSGTDATFDQLSGNRRTRRAKSSDDWKCCVPKISQNGLTGFEASLLENVHKLQNLSLTQAVNGQIQP